MRNAGEARGLHYGRDRQIGPVFVLLALLGGAGRAEAALEMGRPVSSAAERRGAEHDGRRLSIEGKAPASTRQLVAGSAERARHMVRKPGLTSRPRHRTSGGSRPKKAGVPGALRGAHSGRAAPSSSRPVNAGDLFVIDRCEGAWAVLVPGRNGQAGAFPFPGVALPNGCTEGERVRMRVLAGRSTKGLPMAARRNHVEVVRWTPREVQCQFGRRTVVMPRTLFHIGLQRGARLTVLTLPQSIAGMDVDKAYRQVSLSPMAACRDAAGGNGTLVDCLGPLEVDLTEVFPVLDDPSPAPPGPVSLSEGEWRIPASISR